MLLHGSDGPGPRYRTAARVLASTGHRVFVVHYLDRTGDKRAAFREISTKLPAWAAAARDGLAHVAAQPGVDARRVGVLGISLGGGLGLLTAASEPRVRAFVNWFGFMPTGFSRPSRLPPTLVLHGAQDRVVPADTARALERILTATGTPHEVVIYPGQGHGFTGDAQIDAARRTAAFLGQWMG